MMKSQLLLGMDCAKSDKQHLTNFAAASLLQWARVFPKNAVFIILHKLKKIFHCYVHIFQGIIRNTIKRNGQTSVL